MYASTAEQQRRTEAQALAEQLYRDHHGRLLGIARANAANEADAEAQGAALALLAGVLVPFAPHAAEALLLACGGEDGEHLAGVWPERLALPAPAAARLDS
jgi:leucyl-tRNA synthetase